MIPGWMFPRDSYEYRNDTQLPAGWATAQDPNSGNTYFYNRDTGASQWASPARWSQYPRTHARGTGGIFGFGSAGGPRDSRRQDLDRSRSLLQALESIPEEAAAEAREWRQNPRNVRRLARRLTGPLANLTVQNAVAQYYQTDDLPSVQPLTYYAAPDGPTGTLQPREDPDDPLPDGWYADHRLGDLIDPAPESWLYRHVDPRHPPMREHIDGRPNLATMSRDGGEYTMAAEQIPSGARPPVGVMKRTIREAGLPTDDIIDMGDLTSRYNYAMGVREID